ncbi:Hypothetical_protein [Hexamita inflata]|uniref:Hypothetical_protein n=1 Tax=Hexamita inflata TaxID=28002 RepID=A0AA86PCJ6_9EUKA|nr:Hypothetical protein HINF_LOCUS24139 [Hexamita inflata]
MLVIFRANLCITSSFRFGVFSVITIPELQIIYGVQMYNYVNVHFVCKHWKIVLLQYTAVLFSSAVVSTNSLIADNYVLTVIIPNIISQIAATRNKTNIFQFQLKSVTFEESVVACISEVNSPTLWKDTRIISQQKSEHFILMLYHFGLGIQSRVQNIKSQLTIFVQLSLMMHCRQQT